ncbi:MAG TPA: Uma2 family endonuclease [Armatimonadaceae bacterium]|jgi:Uma2 family endonuclease|nr:Uma2 family endonuclease [Armatimonadaceae bacterium]
MTTTTMPAPDALSGESWPRRRLWTRAEYYRAAEDGIFAPGERLELIRGEILYMSPQRQPHSTGVRLTDVALQDVFEGSPCDIRTQLPLTLPDDSEPEPDVLVVRGGIRDYERRHPGPADVLLLVEVSDATLAFDRDVKARLYAEAGIPEYWVLDLRNRRLLAYRAPNDGLYPEPTEYREDEQVTPVNAPRQGVSVRVADLLPTAAAEDAETGPDADARG